MGDNSTLRKEGIEVLQQIRQIWFNDKICTHERIFRLHKNFLCFYGRGSRSGECIYTVDIVIIYNYMYMFEILYNYCTLYVGRKVLLSSESCQYMKNIVYSNDALHM